MIDQAAGEAILRWSVRAAVACWVIKAVLEHRRKGLPPTRSEASLHVAGCLLYLVHVWAAFEFRHDWSHAAAGVHTAAETRRVVGFDAAWGVWVNYFFTAVWATDAVRVSVATMRRQATDRSVDRIVFWFFAFVVLNSTVVFGPAGYRWAGVVIAILWLPAYAVQNRQSRDG